MPMSCLFYCFFVNLLQIWHRMIDRIKILMSSNPDTVSRFQNERRELLRNEERIFMESLGPVAYT